jgi:hypothetical protein
VSIIVQFHPGAMTRDQYDSVIRAVEDSGVPFPPDGCISHVCFGPEGDLRVSEIWDSREQFEAFGAALMPAIAASGVDLTSPPDVYEVQRLVGAQ